MKNEAAMVLSGGGAPATLRVINFAVVLVQKTPLLKKITTYAELTFLRAGTPYPVSTFFN